MSLVSPFHMCPYSVYTKSVTKHIKNTIYCHINISSHPAVVWTMNKKSPRSVSEVTELVIM